MPISRRSLIKKTGFLSLLYFAGYVSRGLCFYSPRESEISIQKKFKADDDLSFDSKHCVLGTRGVGFQVHNNLHALKKEKGLDVLLFTPEMIGIYEYLKDRQVIFLLGCIEDQDFWIARDLALAAKPHLIVSLITCNDVASTAVLHGNLQSNECVILLPRQNALPVALKIIQDFCWSITNSPKLICLDLADIKFCLSGRIFIPLVTESNSSQARGAVYSLVEKNKSLIEITESVYLMLLMDHSLEDFSDAASVLMEHFHRVVNNDDVEIIWSIDPPHHSDIGFRATSLISVNPVLLKNHW